MRKFRVFKHFPDCICAGRAAFDRIVETAGTVAYSDFALPASESLPYADSSAIQIPQRAVLVHPGKGVYQIGIAG